MSLRPPVSADDHSSGKNDAPIELVEYGDYECPHCGRAYPILQKLQHKMGDDLRFIFRNFPLAEMHPHAIMAATAAEAAALQGKFWEMHDIIFEHQQELSGHALIDFAEQLKLDVNKFANDIRSQALADKVEEDFESGMRSGVNGTPTFFINGVKYEGSWEDEDLYEYLQAVLKDI
ncbi:DsbA family protein [Taibaiella soli]|uniref:DsbA family protein n=1 Tax=Taibaiella soli TaxID=1649169 RepID=A0A2W2B3Q1_9BACT|nr:thioredoxin domain-containing protein [Taibaiella soli]PZF74934.1 DsbA family protein [Taibaiella soli]